MEQLKKELDTGWPWPLDGVQAWFEGLWNQIAEWVYNAARTVWDWIPQGIKEAIDFLWDLMRNAGEAMWKFFQDPIGTLQSGFDWVVQQITSGINVVQSVLNELGTIIYNALPKPLRDFADTIGAIGTAIWTGLNDFIKDPIGTLQSGLDWVVNSVSSFVAQVQVAVAGVAQSVWNALPKWIKDGLLGLAKIALNMGVGFLRFIKDPIGTLQDGWNWLSGEIGNAVGAIKAGVEAFVGDVLRGAMEALGSALSGFVDWLLKRLIWLGEMVLGAINAVVGALGGLFTSLINQFIGSITSALSPGSPDKETEQAVNVMVETLWTKQMEMIKEAYPKSPSPQSPEETAIVVAGSLLTATVSSLGVAGVAELAHPIKQLFAHRTVREILWMVGIPAVMASIITLPSAVGLLTPLRYQLNERFQPNIPSAADLVRFELREVFRDEMRAQQLIPPPSGTFVASMAKLGYTKFWAESYWAAHWVLPSITQLNEMLHRKVIDRDTWAAFVRRNDYLPAMIDNLEQIIYSPYTRVDIRRMYDVRVLSEDEMVGAYMDIGYDSERASNLALFSKIYVALPDLRARYRNGWITGEQLLSEIKALGIVEDRAQELFETVVAAEKTQRVAKERDLTKAEIIKGVKAELFTVEEGIGLLMNLGYEDWEAYYLLAIHGIVEAGHPGGYWEMRQAVELYRKSQGLAYVDIPDELVKLDNELQDFKRELEEARRLGVSEEKELEALEYIKTLEMKIKGIMASKGLKRP